MKRKSRDSYLLRWGKHLKAIELLGGKCERCGNEASYLLDFHHKDSDDKGINMNKLFVHGARWSEIEKEIKKCMLLCRNCHRFEHSKDNDLGYGRLRKLKQTLLDIKGGAVCHKCGMSSDKISVFDFHHVDPKNKKFDINGAIKRKDLIQDILDEIDKCVVLCTNCHTSLHFDIKRLNANRDEIQKKIENHREQKVINHKKIKELFRKGYRQVDICNILGYSKSTVCTILSKL